jgi:FtsH-binding integral membrane protein
MTISSAAAPRRFPGRLFLALGLGLAALGVIGYVVQISTGRLIAPWYMPCLATLGVLFLAVALWQARSVWRILALLLVMLLAGAEWAFLLGSRLPVYSGPVAEGRPFPAFATAQADGTTFTQHDLEGDQNNVMVFFRGRW